MNPRSCLVSPENVTLLTVFFFFGGVIFKRMKQTNIWFPVGQNWAKMHTVCLPDCSQDREDKRRTATTCLTHSKTSVACRDTVTVFSDYAGFSFPSITQGIYPPAVPIRGPQTNWVSD